ncbi:MAG: hypothetical protein RLZZ26_74 [Candidatus Parcubacteria bacterium]|jgi:predicted exporter
MNSYEGDAGAVESRGHGGWVTIGIIAVVCIVVLLGIAAANNYIRAEALDQQVTDLTQQLKEKNAALTKEQVTSAGLKEDKQQLLAEVAVLTRQVATMRGNLGKTQVALHKEQLRREGADRTAKVAVNTAHALGAKSGPPKKK